MVDLIASGALTGGDPDRYAGLVGQLLKADPYLVLADFSDYLAAQDRAGACCQDQHQWTRMSILNTAGMGFFSSDRAVAEYAREVWNIQPLAPFARG